MQYFDVASVSILIYVDSVLWNKIVKYLQTVSSSIRSIHFSAVALIYSDVAAGL